MTSQIMELLWHWSMFKRELTRFLVLIEAELGGRFSACEKRLVEVDAEELVVLPSDAEIDPADTPAELDAANVAFRAVTNGYGDQSKKPRIRLIKFLKKNYPDFGHEATERIATVANPVKTPGGMKRSEL